MRGDIRLPVPLSPHHDLSRFCDGSHPELDAWLRDRARASEGLSARTYVLCSEAEYDVIGYYCISAAREQRSVLPSARLRQGMPDEVPLLLIGRLAVDRNWQGHRLGFLLLRDAMQRCIAAAGIAGARAIIVHAIDEAAAAFYTKHNFSPSTLGERLLVMPMETAVRLLG